jgi:aldose 1-epimerase
MSIAAEPWGIAPDGQPVERWTLRHEAGPVAVVATWGATLVSLRIPAPGGPRDIVLGFDALAPYLGGHPYIGAAVGRWANRIADGRFMLDGTSHTLARNAAGHHLHGGERGLSRAVWHASGGENADGPWLQLSIVSPDGEDGFPGTLRVSLRYGLRADALRLDWSASTDRATPVNLTHHAYFNLAGGGDVLGHRLRVHADRFLPVDAGLIPTGELRAVDGTPMDLREGAAIGERVGADDAQVRIAGGFDHCWVLADAPGALRSAAELVAPGGAPSLRVATTEPGLQVYTGNGLDGTQRGRDGAAWPRFGAVCLEAQRFPDSPNRPDFPDTILRPGEIYRQTTVYAFG